MNDPTKLFAYIISTLILVGTYYALVLYPFALDADVKLWLTALAGAATTFVFGDQVASRTQRAASATFDKGLSATPNDAMPTTTIDNGPSGNVTVTGDASSGGQG